MVNNNIRETEKKQLQAIKDYIDKTPKKKDTKIDISYPKFYYGDDVDVTIKLMEKDTNIPLSNKPVILNVNGSISSPINTDNNGIIIKKLNHQILATFKMGAEFKEDDFYNGSSCEDIEIDYSLHTNILAPPVFFQSGENAEISIHLSCKMGDSYNNMPDRKIYIVDNDKVMGFETTDANGITLYKINNITIDHKLILKYTPEEDDFRYDSVLGIAYIFIKNSSLKNTSFLNTDMKIVIDSNQKMEIEVVDEDDTPVNIGNVEITEGEYISNLTLSTQEIFYQLKDTSTDHSLSLKYSDTSNTYNSCSKQINITILKNKITPTLTINPQCIKTGMDTIDVFCHLIDPITNNCLINRWLIAQCGSKNDTTQIADCDISWPLMIIDIVDGEEWIVSYDPTNQPSHPEDINTYNSVSEKFIAFTCSDTPLTVQSNTLEIKTSDTEGENSITSNTFDVGKKNGSGKLISDTIEVKNVS